MRADQGGGVAVLVDVGRGGEDRGDGGEPVGRGVEGVDRVAFGEGGGDVVSDGWTTGFCAFFYYWGFK